MADRSSDPGSTSTKVPTSPGSWENSVLRTTPDKQLMLCKLLSLYDFYKIIPHFSSPGHSMLSLWSCHSHLLLLATQGNIYCYPHFMDENTEAQRGEVIYPRSHSQHVTELGLLTPRPKFFLLQHRTRVVFASCPLGTHDAGLLVIITATTGLANT